MLLLSANNAEVPSIPVGIWDRLFLQRSHEFDVLGFSDLHLAYLGLSGLPFGQVLASTRRSDMDESDSQGMTVLNWAASRGDSQSVAQLLVCGADPNKKDMTGASPLHIAVHVDIATAKLLLTAKADVSATHDSGGTPMHGTNRRTKSLIKHMIELNAYIEICGMKGMTPLLDACKHNEIEVAETLLSCGADINARNARDCSNRYNRNYTLSILFPFWMTRRWLNAARTLSLWLLGMVTSELLTPLKCTGRLRST